MAMNASGIRNTARVLPISPTTVINELKKRSASITVFRDQDTRLTNRSPSDFHRRVNKGSAV
jgi:hypothetical protein